jgi:peptidoglycan/LPS O-acetylase OafA/YrhL
MRNRPLARRLAGIQVLRIFAATLVVAQHGYFYAATARGYGVEQMMPFLSFQLGVIGVFAFFVISGYVIGLQADVQPSRFLLHRVLHIYPAYIAALTIAGLLILGSGALPLAGLHASWSLLLLPAGHLVSWFAVPYWTLMFEVYFYAVAFTLMLGGRHLYDAGLMLWAVRVTVASLALHRSLAPIPDPLQLVISPLALLFIAGASLARFHQGRKLPLLTISCLCLAVWIGFPSRPDLIFLIETLIFVLLAVHLSVWAGDRIGHWWPAVLLSRLGDLSYGLYLMHAPLMVAFVAIVPLWLGPVWLPALGLGFVASLGGLAFGYGEYVAYRRVLRPWADRVTRPQAQACDYAGSSKA